MSKINATITAVGKYLPDQKLTNSDLEKMVDTSDEWITARTGIKERRILTEEGKGTSYLAIKACLNLIEKKNLDPAEIELVIVATATPDMQTATTAAYVASEIGAINAFGFDLEAACSGFLYGMSVASRYIESGKYKKIILVGADKNSSMVDYQDRTTCIIFGDGAAATLFEPNEEGLGLQDEYLRSDGFGRDFLRVKHGGSVYPVTHEVLEERTNYLFQDGKTVFKNAVSKMAHVANIIMERNQLTHEKIQWLAAHQANKRILEATGNRIGIDLSKVMMNIQHYGNTTAATIPLLLCDYESQLNKEDNIIFTAFGGGFTWGSIFFKWSY